MPRIIFLFMVAACAGCAGGHKIAQTGPADFQPVQPRMVVTRPTTVVAKLRPVKSGKLTPFEPAMCVGEKYDQNLIEEEHNQPWLRPINR